MNQMYYGSLEQDEMSANQTFHLSNKFQLHPSSYKLCDLLQLSEPL